MEHLPDGEVDKALAELARVASDNIMIVVPSLHPLATRDLQEEHEYEPSFDHWYVKMRQSMPDFRMTRAELFEPTYWVDTHEVWTWWVRK